MRARRPDQEGYLDQDGVKLSYEVFGDGEPTLLLLPAWTIVHSRFWKAQVPFLSRHHRVVTYDGPGNGGSDRPLDPSPYHCERQGAAVVAVMDATGTERAVLVSLSRGAQWALWAMAHHPERVLGGVFIGPSLDIAPGHPARQVHPFDEPYVSTEGWAKYNRHYWLDHYEDFLQFFFAQCFTEPHSTKQTEDCVGWAQETTPQVLVTEAEPPAPDEATLRAWCARVRHPVLVIHGDRDAITPLRRGEALAGPTGGQLVVLEGAGHIPQARDPVKVNNLIRDFAASVAPPPAPEVRRWTRAKVRRRRALYVSSPIGLGHARRDVAVAKELRRLVPDLEVDWLAQHPVTKVLEVEGERIHRASRFLASESAHFQDQASDHDLNAFQAIRRMDEILVANFMVFHEAVEEGDYDLVVGDEAWDVDYFWHENPELKRSAFCWMTDFVGWVPMPEGGEREAFVTADYNAEMIEQIARLPRVRDRAIFVGNPDDVVLDLYRHLAACDLAVVQGGLTTCMELAACRRPFLYFPLRNHFEQNVYVAHRLDRYGAGRRMDYATATPEVIASAIADEVGREVASRPVEAGGAARAATLIAQLL